MSSRKSPPKCRHLFVRVLADGKLYQKATPGLMRITLLHGNPQNYSCNAYLVRGNSNDPEDVNTLIDVGIDGSICGEIENLCYGNRKEEGGAGRVNPWPLRSCRRPGRGRGALSPRVFAFAPGKHVDVLVA